MPHRTSEVRRGRRRRALAAALGGLAVFGTWHAWKPLPAGLSAAGPWRAVADADVRLLVDSTRIGPGGARVVSQAIFDAVLAAIARAEHTVVLDYFLFNAMGGATPPSEAGGRAISSELAEALLGWRAAHPTGALLVLTDPINDTYGGAASALFARLRSGGVEVASTDLDRLRDSNPLYSALWRAGVSWWEDLGEVPGWLPHPLGDPATRVQLRPWLRLLNFKANHRKVLACDDGAGGWACIVASANPHDASSAHSNIALEVRGAVALDVLAGELAVARMSGWRGTLAPAEPPPAGSPPADTLAVRYVTEYEIERELLAALRHARLGDDVALAMFYLADRDVVRELLAASERGARVRLVLDPNKDAFGRTKDGVPNRQVADELVRRSRRAIEVRWYRTEGEQFHTKLVLVRTAAETFLSLGSANLTRRNLEDLNLEANVAVRAPEGSSLAREAWSFFEGLWQDGPDTPTAPFELYEDRSRLRRLRYFVMERTGLSTF